MNNPTKFAELLRQGILRIQKRESTEKKKPLKDIVCELGTTIGRQSTTIEYYLRGYIPTSFALVETLIVEVCRRGDMEEKWLLDILSAAEHPNPTVLVNKYRQTSVSSLKSIDSPPTKPVAPIVNIQELRPLEERQRQLIEQASSVDTLGVNLWRFLPAFQDEFLFMLSKQGKLRVLLVDPNSSAAVMAAFRSHSGTPAVTQVNRIRDNLTRL